MKKLEALFQESVEVVKELTWKIDQEKVSFQEAEEAVVAFVNRIGHMMIEEIVQGVEEPCRENTLWVGPENARGRYKNTGMLRLIDRFGQTIRRKRRMYQVEGEGGMYCPLDEKLGVNYVKGYTPLMTFLLSYFGGSEAYAQGAKKLSRVLGFGVSATAVQGNTERTGTRLEHHPYKAVPGQKQSEECKVMIIETDGTMSPQIHEEEGITGRESMKQPTEYKECNIIAIEKRRGGRIVDRWVGAQYGKRMEFETYAGRCAIAMGQLQANRLVYIADGAKHNWELRQTNFPEAVEILDYYHAMEHVGALCDLFTNAHQGKQLYARWRNMIYDGDIYQTLEEMKRAADGKVKDRSEGMKHINYFETNKNRMAYDMYREQGFPIGSGLVEGHCKLVVGRRFKASGMRWKKKDNEQVLEVRLALLNETLDRSFKPKPRKFTVVAA